MHPANHATRLVQWKVWDIRYTKVCENRAILHKAHGLGRQMVRRTYSAMIPALAIAPEGPS